MAELNLSVSVMPSKYNTTVSVRMTDTIAEMKEKLSGYLQVLFEEDPSSVGAQAGDDAGLPGDDFYYGA